MDTIADAFGFIPDDGRIRLSLGEVVDKSGAVSTWRARDAFLLALHDLVSDFDRQSNTAAVWVLEAGIRHIDPDFPSDMDVSDPRAAVWEWAASLNLAFPWFIEATASKLVDLMEANERGEADERGAVLVRAGISLETLREYLAGVVRAPGPPLTFDGKEVGDGLHWPLPVPGIDDPGRDGPAFDWNPAIETRADNERRAVEAFRQAYRAAQADRLEEAAEQFPRAAQTKRYEHFQWLVEYQVLRHTYAGIAARSHVSRQTVADAVKDTARLVGIDPLRTPDRPGRKSAGTVLSGNGATPKT